MLSLAAAACLLSQAKVRLPHILSDNMVLQHSADVRLWGWDKPGRTVTVRASWTGSPVSAKTGRDGRWSVTVHTPEAGYTPLSLTFDDGEQTTLSGILAGEVWVAAGQSNMEMPVRGFDQCPVEGYNETVTGAAASQNAVRYCKIPSRMSMRPLDDADCRWLETTPQNVTWASATGYFFARTLHRALGVPVGIIEANKGGTRVESWLSGDCLRAETDERLDSASIYAMDTDYYRPMVWGNATFHPILPYTVRGIIYYQGCSNVGYHTDDYARRLSLLVGEWRKGFGNSDLPFYLVEIAPYFYDDAEGTEGALLRQQQQLAARQIAHSGIVGTNDCAYPREMRQIHPTQKRKVGERLAYLALGDTYGWTNLIYRSPSFESASVEGDKVYVRLADTEKGVQPIDGIEGFELAGDDGVFHKATATADWQRGIIVTCPEVKAPKQVAYCFHNFSLGNLRNQGGLPLLPFKEKLGSK